MFNVNSTQSTIFGSYTSTVSNQQTSSVVGNQNIFATLITNQSNYMFNVNSTQSTIFGSYTSTVSNLQTSTVVGNQNIFSSLIGNQSNFMFNVNSTQSTIFGSYTSTVSNQQTSTVVGNQNIFSTLIGNQSNYFFNIFSTQSTIYGNNVSTNSNNFSTVLGAQSNNLTITVLSSQMYYLGLWSTQSTSLFSNTSTICNYFSTKVSTISNYFSTLASSQQGFYNSQFTIQSSFISTNVSSFYATVASSITNQSTYFGSLLSTQQGIFSTTASTQSNYFSTLISSQVGFYGIQSTNQQGYFNMQVTNLSTQFSTTTSTLSNYFSTSLSTYSNIFGTGTSTTIGIFSTTLSTQLGQIFSTVTFQSNFYSSQLAVLNSTFSTQNTLLISSLNSNISTYSTYLGNVLSTQTGYFTSTMTSTITVTLITLANCNTTTIYQALSSFSAGTYGYINSGFSTLSSIDKQFVNSVSNNVNDVSNFYRGQYITYSTFVQTPTNGVGTQSFPQVTNTCNALLGILSTTFSTFSSITKNFVQTNKDIDLTGNVNLTGTLTASKGVYSRFFNISNVVSTYTYFYTGSPQYYKPNSNANKVLIQMWGAGGARGSNTNGGGGAYVEGIFSADPTLQYLITVGGGGVLTSSATFLTQMGGTGGYGGGGNGYNGITGGGGGATSLIVSNANMDILGVAGGGGGGGLISSFNNWSGTVEPQISSTTININLGKTGIYSNTYCNTAGTIFINSTIFLPVGSWGGPGGIVNGCNAFSPIAQIGNGPFTIGGNGGSTVMYSTPTSNTITRYATTGNVISSLIYNSTFFTFAFDFVPGLMGTSPYEYPSLSSILGNSTNLYFNTSNFTVFSTNIQRDSFFSTYSNRLIADTNYPFRTDPTRVMIKTVSDFYNFSNTQIAMPAGSVQRDYTDKTPTAIYAADLTINLIPIGYPYGILVNMIPFPFDESEPLKFSTARNYILAMNSSINSVTSSSNATGLQYFNQDGIVNAAMTSSYNGSYVTQGQFGSLYERYMYYDMYNLSTYGYQIKAPIYDNATCNTWFMSTTTGTNAYKNAQNYLIISSIYAQVYKGSAPVITQLPTFMPDVSTNFFNYQAASSLTGLLNTPAFPGISTTFANAGKADVIISFFNTNTKTPYLSSLYNIFISSAGTGGSLYATLPLTISGSKINIITSSITTYATNTMPQYISNWFMQNNFFAYGFAVNDVTFSIKTLADFPTIKYYTQKRSTVVQSITVPNYSYSPTQNNIFYGATGTPFMGGSALQSSVFGINNTPVTFAGGGGSGYLGGAAGGVTETKSQYIIGGGGGGGGSSYISPLTSDLLVKGLFEVSTTGYSLPGNGTSSGFATHPTVIASNIGTGGFDVNSLNNWLSTYVITLQTNTHTSQNGGNGLVLLTEYVDPMIVSISSANQNFTPMRIESLTNQVIVNKIVISSAQTIALSKLGGYADDFSTAMLDFGNYQQFYLNFSNSSITQSIHVSNLNTTNDGLNYQSGQILLNVVSNNNNVILDFSTNFKIDTSWTGAAFTTPPGILYTCNIGLQKMDYTIFNNSIYLGAPTYFS